MSQHEENTPEQGWQPPQGSQPQQPQWQPPMPPAAPPQTADLPPQPPQFGQPAPQFAPPQPPQFGQQPPQFSQPQFSQPQPAGDEQLMAAPEVGPEPVIPPSEYLASAEHAQQVPAPESAPQPAQEAPSQEAPAQHAPAQEAPSQPSTRRDARDTGDDAARLLGPKGTPLAAPGISSQSRTFDPAVGRPNGDGAPKTGSSAGLAVGLIAIGVLVIIGLLALVGWLLWPKDDGSPIASDSRGGTTEVVGDVDSDAGNVPAQPAAHVTPQEVYDQLQEMSTLYGAGPDSILFETIEETQQHVFNAAAFQYVLADSASAALYISEDDQASLQKLLTDAETYKQRLLAGEPIGVDVDITGTDGMHFVYDGDTGETIYE